MAAGDCPDDIRMMPARPRRIVLTTLGSFGDINPFVGLALALRARGHEPVIATSECYRAYIERTGVAFHPVRPDADPNDRALIARIMEPRAGTDFLLRQVILPALRHSYDDLTAAMTGADLLVTHPITFAGPLVAERTGVPWASAVLAPISFFSEHDLPVFPPAPWMKRLERIPGGARVLIDIVRVITRRWMDPVRTLRAELGLPDRGDPLYEGQHSPRLVLALYSRLLGAPQRDWPPHVRITGPILYNGPTPDALPAELETFLQAGPPPVVFTLGSSAVSAAGRFYEHSAAAARALGARAVLLAGAHEDNRPTRHVGNDILVLDHAPHAALFPRAAITVHQGGIGTLQQALRAGVPMLVTPFAHDQPDNAYRAARLGVARVLASSRYTARRAATELRRLIADGTYAVRAREVGALVAAEDGTTAACDAIGELLDGAGARPPPA
jgi:UDP:flavonoid glycosyltransferase YjiC (YdhE family)